MKNSLWKKILATGSALTLTLALSGDFLPGSLSQAARETPFDTAGTKDTEVQETLEEKLDDMVTVEENTAADKEETVYVIAGTDGTAQKLIVTEWLKNPDAAAALSDYTQLTDLENTHSDASFTLGEDGALTWDAQGSDIHYRGTTQASLPVTVKITYWLDGAEMSLADMAGKSGHVVIRFDYTNNTKVQTSVNGKRQDVCVPFFMASGLVLDGDHFSNVTVSNGTVFNDGSRNIVVGCALPGLADSLKIQDAEKRIPDFVEIEADTADLSLPMTMTVAMTGLLDSLHIHGDVGMEDMRQAVNDLEAAARELSEGAGNLSQGAQELSQGLNSLSSNSDALTQGADAVFTSLTGAASTQINAALSAAGYDTVSLTPSNYSKVLTGLLDTLSDGAYSRAQAVAKEQVTAAVTQAVQKEVTGQVTQAVQKEVTGQVTGMVKEQVTQQVTAQITKSLIGQGYTQENAAAYLNTQQGETAVEQQVEAQMASDGVKQTIKTQVDGQMATDEVKQTIKTQVDGQMASDGVKQAIKTQVDGQMASEGVTAQIKNAVSEGLADSQAYQSIGELKTQLDNYAAFSKGLKAYTAGVDTASDGASQLVSGAGTLAEGAQRFYSEGIKKLADELGEMLDGDYEELADRLQAVIEAGRSYQSFGGIAQGKTGSVRFIYKTEGV